MLLTRITPLVVSLATGLCAQADSGNKWYRGNLHTHSLWSDGNDVPEMICDWYKNNGYDFVALSDHNILANKEKWMNVDTIIRRGGRKCIGRYVKRFGEKWVELRDHKDKKQVRLKRLAEYRGLLEKEGEFLLIQAEEVSSKFKNLPVHINVTNIQKRIPAQKGKSVRDVMAKVLEMVHVQSEETGQPMLVHLNHPNFGYAITAEDLAAVIRERFYEVWNGHPIVRHRGDKHHASVEEIWDIANTIRIAELKAPPLMGLGTDDSHNYHNEDPKKSITGRGWVMVRASALTPSALIEAMKAGEFYASSGVTLERLHCTEEHIEIQIKPVRGERYVTRFIGTFEGYNTESRPVLDKDGKEIRATRRYSDGVGEVLATRRGTKVRYKLTGKELYVRAVVSSSANPDRPIFKDQRKKAWTQPVGWRKRVKEQ